MTIGVGRAKSGAVGPYSGGPAIGSGGGESGMGCASGVGERGAYGSDTGGDGSRWTAMRALRGSSCSVGDEGVGELGRFAMAFYRWKGQLGSWQNM